VREQRAGGVELLAADHIAIALGGDARLEFQGVFGAALRAGIADAPAVEHALEQLLFCASVALPAPGCRMPNWFCGICPRAGSAALMIANTSARVTNETCGPPYPRDGNAAQAAAGELFDPTTAACAAGRAWRPAGGRLAPAHGRPQACASLRSTARATAGGDVQITLGGCWPAGHQRRSLAARNALAFCTGVNSDHTYLAFMKLKRKIRMSGGPVYIP
jgi:hypothetical protein